MLTAERMHACKVCNWAHRLAAVCDMCEASLTPRKGPPPFKAGDTIKVREVAHGLVSSQVVERKCVGLRLIISDFGCWASGIDEERLAKSMKNSPDINFTDQMHAWALDLDEPVTVYKFMGPEKTIGLQHVVLD